MKNDMKNRMIIMVVGVLMVCLLPMAAFAQQEWQSTSTMQTSGSVYSSRVTEVGATVVEPQATTTANYAPSRPGQPRRDIGNNQDPGHTNDNGSPLGDAVLPLAMMAVLFAAVLSLRRRKMMSKE